MAVNISCAVLNTPLGRVFAAADQPGRLTHFHFLGGRTLEDSLGKLRRVHDVELCPATLDGVAAQVEEYFARRRTHFELELSLEGTAFQKRVWEELCRIPYGTTMSYGELAKRVGMPTGARAVGSANGSNPIALIVPCHRVIGANGTLTGYGGGLPIKRALLLFESGLTAEATLENTKQAKFTFGAV